MPAKKRRLYPGLIQRLRDEPYRFEFFQAVRLLLAHHRQHSPHSDFDALGQVIRFQNSIALSFPPSEIESLEFEWEDDGRSAEESIAQHMAESASMPMMPFKGVTLTPSFIGLTGPSGVLPRHYTQHVAEREIYHRDTATRAFLDIFTSRAVALFYQSWLKYRLHFQYESDPRNCFLPLVLSFAGLGLQGTRERLTEGAGGIGDESLAYYASALRSRPQSIDWFARVVADYFQIRCDVEQFVGQWFDLPPHERTYLGVSNCVLGQTSLCGARVWDRQTRVRLVIGPLRRKQFDDFLPNGAAFSSLRRLFRLMVGTTFDCEVTLILDRRDVAAVRLNSQCAQARLGWDTWCKSCEIEVDSRDTTYLFKATEQVD
ncbi:MAG TPA: type VI secretion system baseplate subunit TssG [Noviherbaspirillum sp.]|nr:type VI secretion system baseplate subunit TssG [Noviherbaspirillum sp.]